MGQGFGLGEIVFAVLGTVWLAFSSIINAMREINTKRDIILTGMIHAGNKIEDEHRKLLYESDWKPLYASFLILTSTFGIVFILLPKISNSSNIWLWIICSIFSGFSWYALAAFLKAGKGDRKQMKEILEGLDEKSNNAKKQNA